MNRNSQIESALDVLSHHLALRGMRFTRERKALLECAMAQEGHFSIDQLRSTAAKAGVCVAAGTAYSAVAVMADAGLLRRVPIEADYCLYERAWESAPHHHMVCTVCGRVRQERHVQLSQQIMAQPLGRFGLQHYSLIYYGVCPRCQRRASTIGQ